MNKKNKNNFFRRTTSRTPASAHSLHNRDQIQKSVTCCLSAKARGGDAVPGSLCSNTQATNNLLQNTLKAATHTLSRLPRNFCNMLGEK